MGYRARMRASFRNHLWGLLGWGLPTGSLVTLGFLHRPSRDPGATRAHEAQGSCPSARSRVHAGALRSPFCCPPFSLLELLLSISPTDSAYSGLTPLAACCLTAFSSCCQGHPAHPLAASVPGWLREGVHCRGIHAGAESRQRSPEPVARAPKWRGSKLEHQEASPPFLPLGLPSHYLFCQGPGWSDRTAAAPQPLPACLAVCSLVQATVGSRF